MLFSIIQSKPSKKTKLTISNALFKVGNYGPNKERVEQSLLYHYNTKNEIKSVTILVFCLFIIVEDFPDFNILELFIKKYYIFRYIYQYL